MEYGIQQIVAQRRGGSAPAGGRLSPASARRAAQQPNPEDEFENATEHREQNHALAEAGGVASGGGNHQQHEHRNVAQRRTGGHWSALGHPTDAADIGRYLRRGALPGEAADATDVRLE